MWSNAYLPCYTSGIAPRGSGVQTKAKSRTLGHVTQSQQSTKIIM